MTVMFHQMADYQMLHKDKIISEMSFTEWVSTIKRLLRCLAPTVLDDAMAKTGNNFLTKVISYEKN